MPYDNFGSLDKSSTGSSMPAWLLPAIQTGAGILQGLSQNNAQKQNQQNINESIDIQRQRLMMERAQQLRDNAMQDAQGHALNPVRSNLYASLAQRLGLPAGTFAFGGGSPQQNAPRPAAQQGAGAPDPWMQQASQPEYQRIMAEADKLAMNPYTKSIAEQLRANARQKYPQLGGG